MHSAPKALIETHCLQPFLALGLELKRHGHRVRLATHTAFRDMVLRHGLEFYPLGGDPQTLSAYMASPPYAFHSSFFIAQ